MVEPEPQVEIVCNRCGHRMSRTPSRLRRGTPVVCPACGAEVVPAGDEPPRSAGG
jgi:DNA-directed RNA polymerase subunit RPC12/RpoP